MPFFDWLEMCGVHPEWFKGSCNVTIGDILSGCIGARHTHIIGPEIKLVCDLEDLFFEHGTKAMAGSEKKLVSRLGKGLGGPKTAAALAGIGGNVTWVYGSNISATYFGPKMEIRRAESISRTAPDMKTGATKESGPKNTDPLDKATATAVKALSVLICVAAIAFDIAIYCEHEKKGSEHTVENLKVLCYTLTGRLMALLKVLEEKATWAEFAEEWIEGAKYVGEQLEKALATNPMNPSLAAGLVECDEIEMVEVTTFAGNALEDD